MGMIDVLLDSGANICIMNSILVSEIGFTTTEVADPTMKQAIIVTNQVIDISGQGRENIITSKRPRVTTTIFTSQDIAPNLLFVSRTVMTALGIFRQQEPVNSSTNHPHQQQQESADKKTLPTQKQQPSRGTTTVPKFMREAIKISLGSMRHQSMQGRTGKRKTSREEKKNNSTILAVHHRREGSDKAGRTSDDSGSETKEVGRAGLRGEAAENLSDDIGTQNTLEGGNVITPSKEIMEEIWASAMTAQQALKAGHIIRCTQEENSGQCESEPDMVSSEMEDAKKHLG